MIVLRDFQRTAVAQAEQSLEKGNRVLVVSPGGSGKTVVIAELARRAYLRGERVLILSHRKEIVDQTGGLLPRMDIKAEDVGVIMAREPLSPSAPIQIASIMTLSRRRKVPTDFQLVLVDETHHVLAPGYLEVMRRFPRARCVGFTATPFRLDGLGLRDFYDDMVVAAMPSELIQAGFLAAPTMFLAPDPFLPDLRDLKVARGDYAVPSLDERVNTREIVGGLPSNYLQHAEGKKAIAFAVSRAHSRNITEAFLAAGIPAAHVDGTMAKDERESILLDFAVGSTMVLSNCLVLSEGYDLPLCEAVVMARPTQSLVLYLQQAARAMRPLGGKKAVILDHARNLERFGLPDADRLFCLTSTKKNRDAWNAGPIKVCPDCGAVVAASTAYCPNCGHVFDSAIRALPEETGDKLTEYARAEKEALAGRLRAYAKAHRWSTEWVDQILALWVGLRST